MAVSYEFYQQRADAAAASAKVAKLANVRERELRSQETWQALADQARDVAVQRQAVERDKEMRREEEARMALDGEIPADQIAAE